MRMSQADRVRPGSRFGRLEVIGESFVDPSGKFGVFRVCTCRCDCGEVIEVRASSLLESSRPTRSCGCLQRERSSKSNTVHGGKSTPLYAVWQAMKERCRNPNDKGYKHYGGRGIAVCPEWTEDFAAFRAWASSHGYKPGLTIERRDVNLGYEPSNCEWIPAAQQSLNRTDNRLLEAFGETKLFKHWVDDPRCVVGESTLRSRLKSGWLPELAIEKPAKNCGKRSASTTAPAG